MAGDLKIVASAANEFEAEMICGVLSEAGIESTQELANTGMGGRFGGGGGRDIYVRAEDLDQAKEALARVEDESQDPEEAES
jgi:hypothetical protein